MVLLGPLPTQNGDRAGHTPFTPLPEIKGLVDPTPHHPPKGIYKSNLTG